MLPDHIYSICSWIGTLEITFSLFPVSLFPKLCFVFFSLKETFELWFPIQLWIEQRTEAFCFTSPLLHFPATGKFKHVPRPLFHGETNGGSAWPYNVLSQGAVVMD